MTLTAPGVRQAVAQHADDPFILLMTIEHEKLDTPIRVARNRQDVVSRSNTYLAFPFECELPTDSDQAPEARITIANIDRRIGHALERIDTPADVSLELVLASTPDTVERAWTGLSFTQAVWSAASVTIGLSHIAYWDEPWPNKRITPRRFPGLFP